MRVHQLPRGGLDEAYRWHAIYLENRCRLNITVATQQQVDLAGIGVIWTYVLRRAMNHPDRAVVAERLQPEIDRGVHVE